MAAFFVIWFTGVFLNLLAIVFGEAIERQIVPKEELDEAGYYTVTETFFQIITPFKPFLTTVFFVVAMACFKFNYEAYKKWISRKNKK